MTFKAKKTAILFVQYQNEFLSEGGKYHSMQDFAELSNLIENSVDLADRAREKGIAVIHVAHVSRPKQKGIIKPWEEAVNSIGGVLSDSTWNADFIDAMKPHPGEIVIHKHTLDVFLSTDLQEILAKKGVEFLAVAGLLTHCCSVESTIRSAYQRDYRFIGLKDCTAAKTKERFLFVEETWPWLCKPMTKNRFLASVRRY